VKVKDGRDELYVHLVKGGWRLRDIDEFHPHSSSCWLRGSTVAIGVLTQKCGGKAVTSDLLNNRTVIGVSAHVRRGLRRCVRWGFAIRDTLSISWLESPDTMGARTVGSFAALGHRDGVRIHFLW